MTEHPIPAENAQQAGVAGKIKGHLYAVDNAEYVTTTRPTKKPKSFRGPWLIVFTVVVLELIFLPYPVNVILALLTFSAGAFTLGIVKLRNQKRSE